MADFLILEKPQKCTILDQYQQPVPEAGRGAFVPGTPLQIISADDLLGDQVTHALQGAFDGKTWYLQKDDAGNLSAGADAKEKPRVFKGCEIGLDTVEIVRDNSVAFSEFTPGSGRVYLKKQETVVRIFRNRDQWYIRRQSGHTVRYGWSAFSSSGGTWRRVVAASAPADTGISDYLQNRIIERFRTANDTYRQYFGHFNTVTGNEKTLPVWKWEPAQAKSIHFFLNAPYRTGSQLDESTRYLVRDIENMLIGKQYDVVCEKGDIVVRPREDAQ